MEYRTVENNGQVYVELLPAAHIASQDDAVDVISVCGEAGAGLLLLHQDNLADEFFDLKSGLAGEVLLKWVSYTIRAALVVSPERIGSSKFYEFVLETNRGRQFYVAQDRETAEKWLLDR